jgi:hypothetical protein
MSATATMNGKPQRKQLADQLDRLDSIIDTLADGLNQVVADACREGTRQAVRNVLIEIANNPELRAMLVSQAVPVPATAPIPANPPESKKPGLWTRLKAKIAAVRETLTGAATKAKDLVAAKYKSASNTVVAVSTATGEALPLRRVLWVGLGVGLLVGLVCLVVPHAAAAAISAVSVATTAVAAQIGTWLKRAARRLGLLS